MKVALIKGDGIGVDVAEATVAVVDAAVSAAGAPTLAYDEIRAGAGYYQDTGHDIEPGGEERAGQSDAIFLGAIGLPSVRHEDGTEISPKYIGNRRLIETAVATLATDRALLLLGVPGTAKSWVSEHLAAAVGRWLWA